MDFPINQHKAHMKPGVDIETQRRHWSITCLTGALSRAEALPPMAGAALHPGPDDPGHVHPHFTFTGQLPQHQAVHLPMRAGRRDGLIRLHRLTGADWDTRVEVWVWGGGGCWRRQGRNLRRSLRRRRWERDEVRDEGRRGGGEMRG